MKQLFTFIIALFAYTAIQAQTPITVVNSDFEDLTNMAKNTSDKWAIKGFFLSDVPLTPAGNYVNDSQSGLAVGQGIGGSQAFKVTPVQPDATSNSTYQILSLTTDSIDISNREFGKYTYKIYIKLADVLPKNRPFSYSCIATDANGVDVTAFTAIANTTDQQTLNATSVFNTSAATADFQPLHGVFDVSANTNTDPLLGSVLNAKYLKFQLTFGKNMPAALTTTYYFDDFTLTGPAENATLSNDATLTSLTLDNGTLSPAFSAEQLNYAVVLSNGTTTIPTVSATTTHASATNVITQAANLSGTEAERKATVEVTAEDGTTKLTYTVIFSVATNNDATLSSLTLDNGTLSPAFSAAQLNYTVVLPNGTATVPTVSATTTHTNATKVITQATNLTGTEAERKATVEVTADDGTTKSTYTVVFSVAQSTDATLSSLTLDNGTLSPDFSAAQLNYTVVLPEGTTTVPTVSATATHDNATTVITQAIKLTGSQANRKATVEVTAEDGTTKSTYSVLYSVVKSTDATLSSLTLDNGTLSPAFSAEQLNYTVVLPNGTTTVPTVSATTTHANATTVITQAANLSGTEAERIATVEVTAEDGTTKSTYSVVFSVVKSTDATLSSLTLDNGTLSPAFSAEQLNYTVVLPNGTTTVPTVSAITTHANATTVITQAANLSGTEAERIATVEVTAEDGTTKSNYTVVISVLTSVNNYMLNDRVKMYPNPVTDIINIEIAGTYNKTSEIIFYNSLGMELKREVLNSENTKIDISSFQLGVNHAVIISKNSVEWRGSFVKNK